ncbi:hypothetical protein JCM3770_001584 [Rhodotorula araucariae]
MAAEIGYHWPALAQQAFMKGTCRAGLSIGEWCTLAAKDQCCGVICPNAPITGPGTIIVCPQLNLISVLIWKSEAPYNLMLQLLATDGALAGLAVRSSTENFRLSAIHAYFAPLAIMSIVPVVIAASTVEIEYFHGISYDGITALNAARRVHKQISDMAKGNSSRRPLIGDRSISEPVTKDEHVRVGSHGYMVARSKARASSLDRAVRDEELKSKAMLPIVASIIFLIHVVAWFAIFIYVYVWFDKPAQENCSDELPIRQYKFICALAVVIFFLIALVFWAALIGGLTTKSRRRSKRYRMDALEWYVPLFPAHLDIHQSSPRSLAAFFAALTHRQKSIGTVAPSESSWSRSREAVRCSICIGIFFMWFIVYVSTYITMLQKFLLLGDNPFDWGQVTALGGVFVPALVVARAVFDNLDGWNRGLKTAERAQRIAEVRAKWLQHGDTAPRYDRKDLAPPRTAIHRASSMRSEHLSHPADVPSDGDVPSQRRPSVAFDTACSGGLTVDQYCNSRIADATCCGVCNIVPISGPGTVLSHFLSTLLNLAFALHFKSETPYTMFFQLWSQNFAVISHFDRQFQGKNRLSLFHYCWVPLTACSVVPLMVACCLSRLKYLHGLSSAAAIAVNSNVAVQNNEEHEHAHAGTSRSAAGQRPRYNRGFHTTANSMSKTTRRTNSTDRAHSYDLHQALTDSSGLTKDGLHTIGKGPARSPSTASANPSKYPKTHKILARVVLWAMPAHLVVYMAVFAIVFAYEHNTYQSSCIEVYGLERWRIGIAVYTLVLLAIGFLFWWCLYKAMDAKYRQDKRVNDGLEVFVYLVSRIFPCWDIQAKVLCREDWKTMKKRKNMLRWGLSIAVYLSWAIPYAFLYIKAGNEFLLPGLNPWPYEQIAGAVSILTPICIVARSYVNEKDGYDGKRKAIEDARILRMVGDLEKHNPATPPKPTPKPPVGVGITYDVGSGKSPLVFDRLDNKAASPSVDHMRYPRNGLGGHNDRPLSTRSRRHRQRLALGHQQSGEGSEDNWHLIGLETSEDALPQARPSQVHEDISTDAPWGSQGSSQSYHRPPASLIEQDEGRASLDRAPSTRTTASAKSVRRRAEDLMQNPEVAPAVRYMRKYVPDV